MILTIDLGTSTTKAALWDDDGLLAVGRAEVGRTHLPGQRVEQDASAWWGSVVDACAAARALAPGAFSSVDVVGLSAVRQTFVPVDASGEPLGPALAWSDRRAQAEATALVERYGGDAVRARTGVVLDGGSVAAKVAWLAAHEPERLHRARWLVGPKDLVVWRLTGELCTDVTLASATGLYEWAGDEPKVVPELAGPAAGLLPDALPATAVAGTLRDGAARELGLPGAVPVVLGAGDRACEVTGTGATRSRPMVSWGTTANVSLPVSTRPDPPPPALIVTRGALGGWLFEGGLSAAGSALEWLAGLVGSDAARLAIAARSSPPGARGVLGFPWLGGARAPWWRADTNAAIVGLRFDHGVADAARAVVEGVAYDVARCIDAAGAGPLGPEPAVELVLGGAGSTLAVWTEVLTGVTGLAATSRRSGEAASAGAALLAGSAVGIDVDLERLDPVTVRTCPDATAVEAYEAERARADAVASALMALREGRRRRNDREGHEDGAP